MIQKLRTRAAVCVKRLINRQTIKSFVQEFLPRDRYLEPKLQEICSECPLHGGIEVHRGLSPADEASLDGCRMRYFGLLLQSFAGKPGDEETEWLYSYLKKCEECLLSNADNRLRLQEVGQRWGIPAKKRAVTFII
jgi:hypothetical protein